MRKRDIAFEGRDVLPIRSRGVIATFKDKYGHERTIHKAQDGKLALMNGSTVIIELTNAAGPLVGKRIRATREGLCMGRTELALKAGFSGDRRFIKNRIAEIEHGKRGGVKLGTLYALALVLGCHLEDLLPTPAEVLEASNVASRSISVLDINLGGSA